jgi:hypothetical protein
VLNLILLQIPNAAVLLFPAWFQPGRAGTGGIEVTGQRLIALLGQMLALVVALLPAAAAFAAAFFLAKLFLSLTLAVLFASAIAALVLAVEAALGLLFLGRLFARFDVGAESAP